MEEIDEPVSRGKKHWTDVEDRVLESLYMDMPHRQIALILGRGEGAVRNRCYEKGWRKQAEDWTTSEIHELLAWYLSQGNGKHELNLDEISTRLGRHKTNVCRKARELGLTDRSRPVGEAFMDAFRESHKGMWDRHEHPRGMLGKNHTEEAKAAMSASQKVVQGVIPKKKRRERALKAVATKIEKYGTGNPGILMNSNAYSRCKGGRREDIGDFYFRSAWEANYARYLNLLISYGKIARWEYEPDTFVFEGETRGAISYLPDFKVWAHDGSFAYHEVKGWMDGRSKTKLKRMKKHYPHVKIIVIGEREYKKISEYARLIPGWEGQ